MASLPKHNAAASDTGNTHSKSQRALSLRASASVRACNSEPTHSGTSAKPAVLMCHTETSFDISTHPTHVSQAFAPNPNSAKLLGDPAALSGDELSVIALAGAGLRVS
jgi:hypothetical protein